MSNGCQSAQSISSSVTPSVLGPEQRADSTMSILGPCVALAWDTSVTVLVFWQVT